MIGDTNVRAMPVAAGTQISTLEVGTLVKMNLQGAPWEWRIVHQGLPGSMYDQSCDGCWLMLENIHSKRLWDSTNNDYKNSDIQAWLQSDFFSMLDSGIQSQVKQVKIPYRPGSGRSSTVNSGANGLSCKIFLLSAREIGYGDEFDAPNDGEKLGFFIDNVDDGVGYDNRVAKYNGIENEWALRSPTLSMDSFRDCVLSIDVDGSVDIYYYPANLTGIRPTLILPSTALVDDDLNVLSA